MTPREALLALLVAAIWGCNFSVIKFGLAEIPPLFYTTIRFAVSSLVLLPFYRFPREHAGKLLRLSLVFGLGHFGLFFLGMSLEVEAATASVLMQCGPPFAVLLGVMLFHETVSRIQVLGLLMACAGVVLIIGLPKQPPSLPAAAALLASAFLWAFANFQMKELRDIHPLQVMCWLSFFGAFYIGLLWIVIEGAAMPAASPAAYASIAYPAIVSTVAAYGLWNYLLGSVPVSVLTPFSLLVSVFGIAAGVMFRGDHFGLWHAAGSSMVLLGVCCTSVLHRFPRQPRRGSALIAARESS